MRVHVLTPGFTTPNGCAFLVPLVVFRGTLAERDIAVHFFHAIEGNLGNCDVLLVDSKYHRLRWPQETEAVLAEFAELRRRCGRLVYFDLDDSTGGLHVAVMPFVDRYCKSQVLRDRSLYLKPMYGTRIYTDYYHRANGVSDSRPVRSKPVAPEHLGKIAVSWNSGLADYSPSGRLRMALYRRLPWRGLLRFPRAVARPGGARPVDLSCRFGAVYPRETVAWQRRAVREQLAPRASMQRLSRRAYFRELAASKIVASPFGFGEINYRDYETFLAGGLLLKPDMSHLETWPDLFRANETILAHRWDLSDLEARIDEALADYPRFSAVAKAGQETYLSFTSGPQAADRFCARFAALIADAPAQQTDLAAAGS